MEMVPDMDLCATAGEKMNETEIDALMAGQEDENGSVHYEGKPSNSQHALSSCFSFFTNVERETFEHTRSCFCSFRQAHHVCVRGQQRELKEL